MKKLLLTGFGPFLNYPLNPTEEIVKSFNSRIIGNYEITSRVLPVDFRESAKCLVEHYQKVQPHTVISLGLAGGLTAMAFERIAVNCKSGEADNRGVQFEDEPIERDGPAGYFSTLPNRKLINVLKDKGYPANISNTAGTYLCNHVMYAMLHQIRSDQKDIRAGFVHLPASHQLAIAGPKIPSWSIDDLKQGVFVMIEGLDD